jgi:hypothetical protein
MKLKTPDQEIEAPNLIDAVCTALQAEVSNEALFDSTVEDIPVLDLLKKLAIEEMEAAQDD